MKRLILILALICFVIGLHSQTVNMRNKTFNFRDPTSATAVSNDTVSGTTAIYWDIRVFPENEYEYDIYLKLDSAGDGTDIAIGLYGSYGTNYDDMTNVQIGSDVTWGVTTTDTTIRWQNATTENTVSTSIASHTEIHSGTKSVAAFDIPYVGTQITASYVIAATDSILYDDTLTVAQQTVTRTDTSEVPAQTTTFTDTVTVAAQTITTTTTDSKVGWQWLIIKATGAGAGAGAVLNRLDVAIFRKPD